MPEVKQTHIGGQAVLEGIMMRGKYNWAVAVREPDGDDLHRGARPAALGRARAQVARVADHPRHLGLLRDDASSRCKAFRISAEQAGVGETEEEQLAEALSSGEIGFTMVLGLGLAVGLFIVLPAVVTNLLVVGSSSKPLPWNVIDGVLRLVGLLRLHLGREPHEGHPARVRVPRRRAQDDPRVRARPPARRRAHPASTGRCTCAAARRSCSW